MPIYLSDAAFLAHQWSPGDRDLVSFDKSIGHVYQMLII